MVEVIRRSDRDEEGYWLPIIVRCDCGTKVTGNGPGDDFECYRCHQIYNAFAQKVTAYLSDHIAAGWDY